MYIFIYIENTRKSPENIRNNRRVLDIKSTCKNKQHYFEKQYQLEILISKKENIHDRNEQCKTSRNKPNENAQNIYGENDNIYIRNFIFNVRFLIF